MTKICQLITQLEPGGAQRIAFQLAKGLSGRGYDVSVLALYDKSPTDTEGVRVDVLREARPSAKQLPGLMRDLRSRLDGYDVLVSHCEYANVIGALAGWAAHVPGRLAVQHLAIGPATGMRDHIDNLWGTLGVYTNVVGVGREAAAGGSHRSYRYRRRLHVIVNGVQLPEPVRSRDAVRAELGVGDGVLLALHIGRWSEEKNQSSVLQMAARTHDAVFALAGPDQPEVATSGNVRLLGSLGRVELSNLMHAADVLLCPSRFEAMPLVMLEGLSAGLAVIASDIAPHHEVLGEPAVCLPPAQIEAWVGRIERLASDSELLRSERKRSLDLAAPYSLDRMVDEYESLLCPLAAR
jgi:glycosyltransferase involved in cell wall biosynthesis